MVCGYFKCVLLSPSGGIRGGSRGVKTSDKVGVT